MEILAIPFENVIKYYPNTHNLYPVVSSALRKSHLNDNNFIFWCSMTNRGNMLLNLEGLGKGEDGRLF